MANLSNGALLTGSGLDGNDLVAVDADALSRQPNRGVIPRFFTVPRKNDRGAFTDVEYVEILVPGDAKSIPCHLVDDVMIRRFPHQYRAWKAGLDMAAEGTPIELLVGATAQMFQLKSLNIHTVEQVAGLSDGQLGAVGMGGRDLRDRATRFLENKATLATVEETARKDAEMAELRDQVARLTALVSTGHAPTSEDDPVDSERPPEGAVLSTSRPVRRGRNGGDS